MIHPKLRDIEYLIPYGTKVEIIGFLRTGEVGEIQTVDQFSSEWPHIGPRLNYALYGIFPSISIDADGRHTNCLVLQCLVPDELTEETEREPSD